jgi:hypothetical protein
MREFRQHPRSESFALYKYRVFLRISLYIPPPWIPILGPHARWGGFLTLPSLIFLFVCLFLAKPWLESRDKDLELRPSISHQLTRFYLNTCLYT